MSDEVCTLAGIDLPVDMEWIDRFTWSAVAQQREFTLAGTIAAEESTRLAGRPITLRTWQSGNTYAGAPTLAQVQALMTLANTARATPMELVLPDGGTWRVYFDHAAGAVEARPLVHTWPAQADDRYTITIRLWADATTPEA